MTSVSGRSLREQQADLTRELILRALAELLGEGSPEDVPVGDVARRAGVSLRTVYRYFPTREELFAAGADWINEQVFGGLPFDERLDDVIAGFREACATFERNQELVRSMALSEAGRNVRAHRRARRLESLRVALDEVTSDLPAAERRQAEAVFAYLHNMLAWVTLRDEGGLSGDEIPAAVTWAMTTLRDDLRRRNDAAGARKGRDDAG